MIYGLVLVTILGVCLLLRLHWITGCFLGVFSVAMTERFRRKRKAAHLQEERFEEAYSYMETAVYNFVRERKIEKTTENLVSILAPGPMRTTVSKALEYMKLTFDETEVYREALSGIEREYTCSKMKTIHDFFYHVETYGGDVKVASAILLEDLNHWQKRIRAAIADRKRMYHQTILSVAASLLICGIVLHMPIRNMDITGNILVQVVGLLTVVADECILLRAQKFLNEDWLQMEAPVMEEAALQKFRRYQNYSMGKAQKKSYFLAGIGSILMGFLYFRFGKWAGFCGLLLVVLFLNQHKVDVYLLKKSVIKAVQLAFPRWLLDMNLFLQTENVQVSLQKSQMVAPAVLVDELAKLNARLELEAESSGPYHDFLKDFEIPEVHSSMCMLYSISMGNSSYAEEQMKELTRQNMLMMDEAELRRAKDRASGLYLLFLAPVLTASVKLLVDMFVMMFAFLTTMSL